MFKYLLACLLLLPSILFSQRSLLFRNYTLEEGLSQSVVTAIEQDENSSLWIGTQDGLNRYDGHNFVNFTMATHSFIQNDFIKAIFKSSDKIIWFGTQNGLFYYNSIKEQFTKINHRLANSLQVESIIEDDQHTIWIGSYNNGILYIEKNATRITPYINSDKLKNITSIFQIDKNRLGVISDGKLFSVDKQSKSISPIDLFQDREVKQVQLISDQKVLVGTSKGAFLVDRKTFQFQVIGNKELVNEDITSLAFDKQYYFIGTNANGLYVVDRYSGQITHAQKDRLNKNAIIDNTINTIFKDKSNVIWVGSNYGLSNFNIYQNNFKFITASELPSQGLPNTNVWCFEENNDGRIIFIGTDNYVSFYNRNNEEFTHCRLEVTEKGKKVVLKDAFINDIQYVNENLVLVATSNGLFKLIYNGGKPSFIPVEIKGARNEIESNRIYSIMQISSDVYFLGTKDGVIKYRLKENLFEFFYHDPADKSNTISAGICRYIFKDNYGKVHFFTSEGGMSTWDFIHNTIKPSEYNQSILSKTKDYITSALQINEELWMGTLGSGVIRLNLKSSEAKVYNHKAGLINNVIYGLLDDNRGSIWLSTNKGLARINPKTDAVNSYKDYGSFLMTEYNQGAFFKSKNGELFFGGINGYNFFNPEDIFRKTTDTKVSITLFKVGNETILPGENKLISKNINFVKELRLTRQQNNISFRIMAEDLGNSNLVKYKYILEGDNVDEVVVENQNLIHFSSLQPGNYILKIYAKMGDSDWSSQPKVLHIDIKAPFWKTIWFWILVSISGAIFTLIYLRIRIERTRREQVFLELKIAERTKEIRKQNIEIEKQGKIIEEKNNKLEVQKELLEVEKSKTDKLLKNILPESTFNELKEHGKVTARSYDTVSVMFTDFVGFTKISENLTPIELVTELDMYFTEFDRIIVKNNLEKIKTIGDAYMCAGGIPIRNKTNPIETCLAALEIQNFMKKIQLEKKTNGENFWELRLGINTGEITAGVIGKKKLAYDIWGSTVNKANRMEIVGEANKVTISGATYEHIKFYFDCQHRGTVMSKSNEEIEIYTVNRIKKELAEDPEGIIPNEKFWKLVNLHLFSQINYAKAEKHIIKLLEERLSPKLHYHSIEHTFDVVRACERIAIEEGITDENLFLLKTAALFHDAGFIEQYEKNEPIGARLAQEILPIYGYSPEQIQGICQLIYVTQIPHKPTNLMEQIMCDADLDYLGRKDFFEIGDRLRRELREHKKINSDRAWDEMQVHFLTHHRYFTETSIKTRVETKKKHLEKVKQRLEIYTYKD